MRQGADLVPLALDLPARFCARIVNRQSHKKQENRNGRAKLPDR